MAKRAFGRTWGENVSKEIKEEEKDLDKKINEVKKKLDETEV